MLLIQLVTRLSSNAFGIGISNRFCTTNQTNCSSSARGYALYLFFRPFAASNDGLELFQKLHFNFTEFTEHLTPHHSILSFSTSPLAQTTRSQLLDLLFEKSGAAQFPTLMFIAAARAFIFGWSVYFVAHSVWKFRHRFSIGIVLFMNKYDN